MTDHLDLARREYQAKRYSLAVQFAQYALAIEPDDAAALQLLGMAGLQTCDFHLGINALEHLALIHPLGDDCRIELAIAYGCVGRCELSRDLLMTLATSDQIEPSQLLRIATGLEAVNEPRLAMEACRQAGKRAPEIPEVHYQMGYYAQLSGHPISISEALIRHAIDLAPNNFHFRIGLASLLIRLGRKGEAIAVVDRMIPDRLSEVTCRCCLKRIANLFFDCDDLARARLCARRLKQLNASQQHHAEAVA